ncbi:MAG TPA: Gfo/Idh/MocA family oxidoreductase, partial [Geminicoccaceae bacterium]|nr:Gfo/Idh/MocA family oxidoreductase [Geminicoccaceae bacterium]
MTEAVRIAVAGAGLIGKRHVEAIAAAKGAALACIVDPAEAARTYAEGLGAIWYPTLAAMFEAKAADGVILATPNQMHVENGIECVAAGVPALVEKPVAIDVAGAEKLVAAGEAAGLPLLVGHHRRHNQLVQRAQEVIRGGAL